MVTRGYHLTALPSMRARAKAATDWLVHASLGEDFIRVGLLDEARGTVGDLAGRVEYLSAEATRAVVEDLPPTPS